MTCLAIIVGTSLLTLSAKTHLPFYPVPLTLQTGAVLLIGLAFGARLGALTVVIYLLEGAFGLPVFSGSPERGVGLAYLAGPTGGYLVGFVPAAFIAGWVCERFRHPIVVAIGFLGAMAIIYLLGLGWLSQYVGLQQAVAAGALPFILGDLIKIAMVAAIAQVSLGRWQRDDH